MHHECSDEELVAVVDVENFVAGEAGTLVAGEAGTLVPPQASTDSGKNARLPFAAFGPPWRLTLERRWTRKLDEVIALSAACEGMSVAGDDMPVRTLTLPFRRLHDRTARAYEDLTAIADAIDRVDDGTYGRCQRCARPVPGEWLARDPLVRYCRACCPPAPRSG